VIVFAVEPVCLEYQNPECDTEVVTGYTRQDVIDAAQNAGVSLYMMNAGYGSYEEKLRIPFQEIAAETSGWYVEEDSDIWPMLHALENAFDAVADDFYRVSFP
jgi:hypothetical protein